MMDKKTLYIIGGLLVFSFVVITFAASEKEVEQQLEVDDMSADSVVNETNQDMNNGLQTSQAEAEPATISQIEIGDRVTIVTDGSEEVATLIMIMPGAGVERVMSDGFPGEGFQGGQPPERPENEDDMLPPEGVPSERQQFANLGTVGEVVGIDDSSIIILDRDGVSVGFYITTETIVESR